MTRIEEVMNIREIRVTAAFMLMTVGLTVPVQAQAPVYAALDPRGSFPAVERVPLAPRLPSLEGKRIHVVMSWPSGSGSSSST